MGWNHSSISKLQWCNRYMSVKGKSMLVKGVPGVKTQPNATKREPCGSLSKTWAGGTGVWPRKIVFIKVLKFRLYHWIFDYMFKIKLEKDRNTCTWFLLLIFQKEISYNLISSESILCTFPCRMHDLFERLTHLPLMPHICVSESSQHWFR